MKLTDLTPEVQSAIASALADSIPKIGNDYVLYALALTCKTLYHVVEPHLYTRIVHTDWTRTLMFFNTILEQPRLAQRVKYVSLNMTTDPNEKRYHQNDSRWRGVVWVMSRLAVTLEKLNWYNVWDHIQGQRIGTEKTAWTYENMKHVPKMLLHSMPNIEFLQIQIGDPADLSSVPHRSSFSDLDIPGYQKHFHALKEVVYSEFNGPVPFEMVQPFFYLTSVRIITVHTLYTGSAFSAWEPEIDSANVEELKITHADAPPAVWNAIFVPLSKLKSFYYSPRGGDVDDFGDYVRPYHLSTALSLVKSTLERLELTRFPLSPTQNKLLTSLEGFPRLKDVRLQLHPFIGAGGSRRHEMLWDLLPSSLEGFEAFVNLPRELINDRYHYHRFLDQLIGVAERKATRFPVLKLLSVADDMRMRSFHSADKNTLEKWAQLEQACSEEEVDYGYFFQQVW